MRAYTLIELMVTIFVISLLVGIIMPTLAESRRASWVVRCAATERDAVGVYTLYRNANREAVPMFALELGDPRDFDPLHQSDPQWKCAAAKQYRRYNPYVNFVIDQQIGDYLVLVHPTLPLQTGRMLNILPKPVVWDSVRFHEGRYNRAWLDGHVELMK